MDNGGLQVSKSSNCKVLTAYTLKKNTVHSSKVHLACNISKSESLISRAVQNQVAYCTGVIDSETSI